MQKQTVVPNFDPLKSGVLINKSGDQMTYINYGCDFFTETINEYPTDLVTKSIPIIKPIGDTVSYQTHFMDKPAEVPVVPIQWGFRSATWNNVLQTSSNTNYCMYLKYENDEAILIWQNPKPNCLTLKNLGYVGKQIYNKYCDVKFMEKLPAAGSIETPTAFRDTPDKVEIIANITRDKVYKMDGTSVYAFYYVVDDSKGTVVFICPNTRGMIDKIQVKKDGQFVNLNKPQTFSDTLGYIDLVFENIEGSHVVEFKNQYLNADKMFSYDFKISKNDFYSPLAKFRYRNSGGSVASASVQKFLDDDEVQSDIFTVSSPRDTLVYWSPSDYAEVLNAETREILGDGLGSTLIKIKQPTNIVINLMNDLNFEETVKEEY